MFYLVQNFKIFKNLSWVFFFFFLLICYLAMYYLTSTYILGFSSYVSTSHLIILWSESRHCMLSILLNLLGCVLWPGMWSLGEHSMWVKHNVDSTVGWGSPWLSVIYSWLVVEFIWEWVRDSFRYFTTEETQTSNKHMKKCLSSLAVMEMQIKITATFTPLLLCLLELRNSSWGHRVLVRRWILRNLYIAGWTENAYSHLGKAV